MLPSPTTPPRAARPDLRPEVSVCIPAYNAADWIERAVRSALEQTHESLEIVVVDNASTDATVERLRELEDRRLRVYRNSRNLGVYRNFNRAIALSRGRYIKFLCADDVIYPDCVEAMVDVFKSDPRVGLVFSPRDIELEDPSDRTAARWKRRHERTHTRFGTLPKVTRGDVLLAAWVDDGFVSNWIGEPTNVMMSRNCLREIGTFPLHMHERGEADLWARAMLFYSIGYVDRPLARFAVRSGSLSAVNRDTGQAWLDPLWLLEGLLTYDEVRKRHPRIARLRTKAILRNIRNVLRRTRVPDRGKLRDAGGYVGFMLLGRGDRSKLYGAVDDRGEPGETVELDVPSRARGSDRGDA